MKPATNSGAKPGPKPKKDTGEPISVRIRPEHKERLDEYHISKGISRAAAIQIAVAELLERHFGR